jgi:hypothetical protein
MSEPRTHYHEGKEFPVALHDPRCPICKVDAQLSELLLELPELPVRKEQSEEERERMHQSRLESSSFRTRSS